MTNYESWQEFTSGITSPQSFINFGFYHLIAACLQRRVWLSAEHSRLFPNHYSILVAPPGVGKGLVIKPVYDLLQYHKLKPPDQQKLLQENNPEEIKKAIEILKEDWKQAEEDEADRKKNKQDFEKPLLFPMAADATTYEALVRRLAKSRRRISYSDENGKTQNYLHSSLTFTLEEISSLFRRHTEDVVNCLIKCYDCGDYEYDTKTAGRDRVKSCCLNFIGGTTPGFMQDTFDDKLLNEGFASRCFFIYETKNRGSSFFIPELTESQRECRAKILVHMERLSHLYGKVTISDDTRRWLEDWWRDHPKNRPNNHPRLDPYYGRKNIHVAKLAMAIHFGESTAMQIEQESFEKAIKQLEIEEYKMHYALGFDSTNPLAKPLRKIIRYIESTGKKTRKEIVIEFFDSLPSVDSIDELLQFAVYNGRLIEVPEEQRDGKVILYYDVPNRGMKNNGD